MLSIKHGMALLSTIAAVGLPMALKAPAQQEQAVTDGQTYSKKQVEYYLSEDEKHYIRPGMNVVVDDLTINADNKVVVDLSFYDDLNQPLDRAGEVTPGPIAVSFILAVYDGETRYYTAYTTREATSDITGETATQATSDSGGAWEDLELGRARYTFGTALPDGYDPTMTHSVALYATRETTDIIGKRYIANVVHDFRPDGGDITAQWAKISNDTCNSCHHELALHGGRRQDVKLCATCHSPQSSDPDTGNTVDMKVMIHKIHMGADLPSVQAGTPYQIIGFRGSVHDYSEVVLPRDIMECANCHRPDMADASVWMTAPSRDACGSCHDNIDWETGEGHVVPQLDDSACAACHQPQGDREFDISVVGARTVPSQSSQLAGLNLEIVEVTDAFPGGFPTISFTIADDDGTPVDPASMNRLRVYFAGMTNDYTDYVRETATEAAVVGDIAMYTFTEAIPETATGTWAFFVEGRREVELDAGAGNDPITIREAAYNPVHYVAMDGGAAEPRRQVVEIDRCNVCHGDLGFHGGTRKNPELCAVCHSPGADDGRDEEDLPSESIHFKWMIHKIHAGAELENGYTVGSDDFGHIGFPGQLNNCESCHASGTYGVPVAEGALDTATSHVAHYMPIKPAASACLACHDSVDAAAHAYTNTAPFGESCAACHGDDRDYSVEQVHAH